MYFVTLIFATSFYHLNNLESQYFIDTLYFELPVFWLLRFVLMVTMETQVKMLHKIRHNLKLQVEGGADGPDI